MRILVPLLLALVGGITSLATAWLLGGRQVSWIIQVLVGACGAFAGLWLRDSLDLIIVGSLIDTVMAAVLGAATLALIVTLLARLLRR